MEEEDRSLILHGPPDPAEPEKAVHLGEYFFHLLRGRGDKVAVVQQAEGDTEHCTFSDLLRQGKNVTHFLRKNGIGTEDTIIICCFNTLAVAPLLLGTLFLGATAAFVNPTFEATTMLHTLKVIGPAMVICNSAAQVAMFEAISQSEIEVPWASMDAIEQVLIDGENLEEFRIGHVDPSTAVAFIAFTGGTTGSQKGVELIHTRVFMQLDVPVYDYNAIPSTMQPGILLSMAGPHWISGLLNILCAIHRGMTLVLLNGFTVHSFLNTIETFNINFATISPNHVVALAKTEGIAQYDVSSLVTVLIVGGPTPMGLYNDVKKKLNINIALTYGFTECLSVISHVYDSDTGIEHTPDGNVGKLWKNTDAKVIDVDTGKLLGRNCDGELCFRCPMMMMKGYRNNPDATVAAFDEDGFLHIGDVGYFDENDYLFITDSIKDLIKFRGLHVSGSQIEDVLLKHPDVMEAAVVAKFQEEDLEQAAGFVVLRQGSALTTHELMKTVEETLLPHLWLYGGLQILESFPRTVSGKIQKTALRDMLRTSQLDSADRAE